MEGRQTALPLPGDEGPENLGLVKSYSSAKHR